MKENRLKLELALVQLIGKLFGKNGHPITEKNPAMFVPWQLKLPR